MNSSQVIDLQSDFTSIPLLLRDRSAAFLLSKNYLHVRLIDRRKFPLSKAKSAQWAPGIDTAVILVHTTLSFVLISCLHKNICVTTKKETWMKLLSVLLGLAFAVNAQAGVTLSGDSVDAGMYRTVDTGRGVGRIMGFGLDGPYLVEDGVADLKKYSSAYTLDVDGDQFTMDYINTFSWGAGIVFRLTDLNFSSGAPLQSLKVDTNMVGYGLKVGADFVEIDLSGVHGTRDIYFNGQFVTAAVPEPSSMALAALGLAALGLGLRKRREKLS